MSDDPVKAVHTARKAVKKERSLLRLARGAMSRKQRRRENHALRDAARRVDHLSETEPRTLQTRALVLGIALDWLRSGATPAADPIFGHTFDQRGLRRAIEEALRELARHSPRRRHRYNLVDLANSIRPPTWM